MTKQDQIEVLAELDGWEHVDVMATSFADPSKLVPDGQRWFNGKRTERRLPDYLDSYDAIIPLIQKQDRKILVRIVLGIKTGQNDVARMVDWLQMTPAQLCELVIRVHGRWKE